MEFKGLWFKGQTAVVEHPTHLTLQVAHNLLVIDLQNVTGQHGLPMVHQRHIIAVVTAQVVKVITKLLPLSK